MRPRWVESEIEKLREWMNHHRVILDDYVSSSYEVHLRGVRRIYEEFHDLAWEVGRVPLALFISRSRHLILGGISCDEDLQVFLVKTMMEELGVSKDEV